MKEHDLKTQMMKLWKETFHDPDEYIKMIFDTYFNPDLIEYTEENGEVVSALLGIPYEFGCGKNKIKAIYLCGLATSNAFRHRGIMEKQIEKCNRKATDMGYAFSFLIPASERLEIYYNKRGYFHATYRVEERYTDIHDFKKDYLSILEKEDKNIQNIKKKYYENIHIEKLDITHNNILDKIEEYIQQYEEKNNKYSTLRHTLKDIKCIIKDNTIFHGKILYALDQDSNVCGIVFISQAGQDKITIPKIYYNNYYVYYKLLDSTKQFFRDHSINIMRYPEETDRKAIWEKAYGGPNAVGEIFGGAYGVAETIYKANQHSKPYGMAKILNIDEILKYLGRCFKDAKFSILIKSNINALLTVKYSISNGEIEKEEIMMNETKRKSTINNEIVFTEKDLAEILFRKMDSSSVIVDAFSIPRLALNMALLLD